MLILSRSFETEFSIAICRKTCYKCQSKTLFLAIFDRRSSIFETVFDCCLSGVVLIWRIISTKADRIMFNSFEPNGISYIYQLNQSISF